MSAKEAPCDIYIYIYIYTYKWKCLQNNTAILQNGRVVLKTYSSTKCPASLRWRILTTSSTYTLYMYIYMDLHYLLLVNPEWTPYHYNDVVMSAMESQITSLTIVYSTVYSGADQRKHQSSASLAFVRGIHRWPVNSPHKGPVTRKMFPFDDVIMSE